MIKHKFLRRNLGGCIILLLVFTVLVYAFDWFTLTLGLLVLFTLIIRYSKYNELEAELDDKYNALPLDKKIEILRGL